MEADRLLALASERPAQAAPASDSGDEAELSEVVQAWQRLMAGEVKQGRAALLTAMQRTTAGGRAQAMAATGLALAELVSRADGPSALVALAPAMAQLDTLPPRVAALAEALSALAHGLPSSVFDVARVHAHAAAAERRAGSEGQEARVLAALARVAAATFAGDQALTDRALDDGTALPAEGLPPLFETALDEMHILRLVFDGKGAAAAERMDALLRRIERPEIAPQAVRTLSQRALRHLEDLDELSRAHQVLERAEGLARQARLGPGVHGLFLARSLAEASLRAGDMAGARRALDEVRVFEEETGLPATAALGMQGRQLLLEGDYAGLRARAEALRACALPDLSPIARAYAAYFEALALLGEGDDAPALLAAFGEAERQGVRWGFLGRDVTIFAAGAHLAFDDAAAARAALLRVQRAVERRPSAWSVAHLRRLEGGLAALEGDLDAARQHLEAALAAFRLAQDRPDALQVERLLGALGQALGDQALKDRADQARAELAALGIVSPGALLRAEERLRSLRCARPRAAAPAPSGLGPERLLGPLARLTVRGVATPLLDRELVAAATELLGRPARLEELGAAGEAASSLGAPPAEDVAWIEFGDGAGRRLRLGAGALRPHERAALTVLTSVASLALEVAALRGTGAAAAEAPDGHAELPYFVAASSALRRVRTEVAQLARARGTVIVTGESGTGKEIVAKAIHDLSPRSAGPFGVFNCAAVPRELFEAQLFGHRRGAFTGATSDQPGSVRSANGGTLFLDEIGELPLDVQPKLLRFLENQEITPVGSPRPVQVDVRVVAATHRDLGALVRAGSFRQDLFYRLQVLPVRLPPLRERTDDILPLARHFLRQLTAPADPPALAPDAVARLLAHRWPGNVRELRNVLERALAYAQGAPVLTARTIELP